MNLRFGVYSDVSGHTCSYNPNIGSKGSYELDARTFADWHADYVKLVRSQYTCLFSLIWCVKGFLWLLHQSSL